MVRAAFQEEGAIFGRGKTDFKMFKTGSLVVYAHPILGSNDLFEGHFLHSRMH